MENHYKLLQVAPDADAATIETAYTRLREQYDPARLAGAADELVQLAEQKRDALERAYAVLSDPQRRASYDTERAERAAQDALAAAAAPAADDDDLIDYRPLPPAKRQERPRNFDPQPTLPPSQATRQAGRAAGNTPQRPLWLASSVVVAVLTFGVMLTSLFLTDGGRPQVASTQEAGTAATTTAQEQPPAPTMTMDQIVAEYEAQVVTARQVAVSLEDNALAWRRLGDALYDSVQVIRERDPDGELYQERIPRWLEASEAYATALELEPDNAAILSERGVTQCYYGAGTGDQAYVQQGLEDTHDAAAAVPEDGRVLMNLGICLISSDPPQTDAAVAQWEAVLAMPAAEMGVTRQAELLLEQYRP